MAMQQAAYRILLADGRIVFRQGFRVLLERFPDLIVAGEAVDEYEALERARDLQPDVILMDLHVPDFDALQATCAIRSALPHMKILILALETDDPSLVYQAIRAGARGYVFQHTGLDDLAEAIRLVAQGQPVLAPQSLNSLVNCITQRESSREQGHQIDRLTAREREVLDLVARGVTNREIAQRLYVSESTVRSHMHKILDKLELANRVQAAALVLATGHTFRDERRDLAPNAFT